MIMGGKNFMPVARTRGGPSTHADFGREGPVSEKETLKNRTGRAASRRFRKSKTRPEQRTTGPVGRGCRRRPREGVDRRQFKCNNGCSSDSERNNNDTIFRDGMQNIAISEAKEKCSRNRLIASLVILVLFALLLSFKPSPNLKGIEITGVALSGISTVLFGKFFGANRSARKDFESTLIENLREQQGSGDSSRSSSKKDIWADFHATTEKERYANYNPEMKYCEIIPSSEVPDSVKSLCGNGVSYYRFTIDDQQQNAGNGNRIAEMVGYIPVNTGKVVSKIMDANFYIEYVNDIGSPVAGVCQTVDPEHANNLSQKLRKQERKQEVKEKVQEARKANARYYTDVPDATGMQKLTHPNEKGALKEATKQFNNEQNEQIEANERAKKAQIQVALNGRNFSDLLLEELKKKEKELQEQLRSPEGSATTYERWRDDLKEVQRLIEAKEVE